MPAERDRHARRPVGTIVVSTRSAGSRTITVTSIRCGNGNAGASTSIDARSRAVLPRSRADRPSIPARHEEAVDRQPVVVDGEVSPSSSTVDAGGAVAAAAPAGSPTVRAAGAPRSARSQRLEPPREGEVLLAAGPQRDAGHTQVREEHARQTTTRELDRRFTPEPSLARDRAIRSTTIFVPLDPAWHQAD